MNIKITKSNVKKQLKQLNAKTKGNGLTVEKVSQLKVMDK